LGNLGSGELPPDPLRRSRVTTSIKTCRSERKAADNQQVVTNADELLAPSLSSLGSRFATICHNYYYVFPKENRPSGESSRRIAWAGRHPFKYRSP
jgi:hypothetical protein